ncbi:hypothetical protein B0H16DRAFT_108203 [Mycena metata]|uniref:Uncharacterized protein n=1 Tax=Mycena metata TaxID=1033252 RepID=A0AAD7I7Y4_9AGAR|nr:hypothetical protein B0H16DRAFT_108203 [Mycena metata]
MHTFCSGVRVESGDSFGLRIWSEVQVGWISHLRDEGFQTIAEALNVGEEYGLATLVAFGCYLYLQKMVKEEPKLPPGSMVPPFRDHPWLKSSHRLRILSGAWSQAQAWAHFAATVPHFPPTHRCPWSVSLHPLKCVTRWEEAWREAVISAKVLAHPTTNLMARRSVLQEELESELQTPYLLAAFNQQELFERLETGHAHFRNGVLE